MKKLIALAALTAAAAAAAACGIYWLSPEEPAPMIADQQALPVVHEKMEVAPQPMEARPGPTTEGEADRNAPVPPQPGGPVPVRTQIGAFFQFAVPAGWRVQEEGQFAVVLIAPDNGAVTLMTGNSGLPVGSNPAQFVSERLLQLRPEGLQLGQPRAATPLAGCATAWELDYAYAVNGEPCRGLAKCSIAPSYDTCTMVLTCAASKASQWAGYAPWLPQVTDQVAALNGAAFGARGVMQQNLRSSIAIGEQARQNREWSAQTWAEVNRERAVDLQLLLGQPPGPDRRHQRSEREPEHRLHGGVVADDPEPSMRRTAGGC